MIFSIIINNSHLFVKNKKKNVEKPKLINVFFFYFSGFATPEVLRFYPSLFEPCDETH